MSTSCREIMSVSDLINKELLSGVRNGDDEPGTSESLQRQKNDMALSRAAASGAVAEPFALPVSHLSAGIDLEARRFQACGAAVQFARGAGDVTQDDFIIAPLEAGDGAGERRGEGGFPARKRKRFERLSLELRWPCFRGREVGSGAISRGLEIEEANHHADNEHEV